MWYFPPAMAHGFLRICFLISLLIVPMGVVATQSQTHDAARKQFQTLCSRCHGNDGNGGEMGPPIVTGIVARSDAVALVDNTTPQLMSGNPTR